VFPSSKGLALGIITTFAYATASLGPISIGYIGDHYSLGTALWAVCVPCAFVAACMFLATVFLKKGPTLDS
jgi:MFS family permease